MFLLRVARRGLQVPVTRSYSAAMASQVQLDDNYLRLNLDGHTYDYHYFWLRHNCDSIPRCRHPKTLERLVDSSEVPMTIKPTSARLDGANLHVEWQESPAHASVFSLPWLVQHAYGTDRKAAARPTNDMRLVEIDYTSFLKPDGTVDPSYFSACEERLRRTGAVVVRNRGLDTEAIIDDFLPRGSSVIETHFGRIEDLRTDNTTNKNTDQLGYTNAEIHLHTDQPFIADPPGMQLLQSIRRADVGGESFVVDSRQAALFLRDTDYAAWRTLTTVPVAFHRRQKAFESVWRGPIIQLGTNGPDDITQIRHSYFTLAPHNLPFSEMEEFYRAYNKYSDILRDPRHRLAFMLESGDFVLYDNFRMLHARYGFSGPRHLRGVYFNHLDVWKKLGQAGRREEEQPIEAAL